MYTSINDSNSQWDTIRDIFNGHINVFIYVYATLKHIFKKLYIKSPLNEILSKTIGAIITLELFITFIPLQLVRLLLYITLKIIHGDEFHSLLTGEEAMMMFGGTKIIVTNLLLVEFPGSGEELYQKVRKHAAKAFSKSKFEKIHLRRKKIMSYYYYLKTNSTVDCCVKTFLKNPITSEDLQKHVSELNRLKLPHDDSGMWDVYVGMEKLKDRNVFPILFRFHHSLCDAATVLKIFARDFAESSEDGNDLKDMTVKPRPIVVQELKEARLNSFMPIDFYEKSPLYDNKTKCNEKELVWLSDDSEKYLNLVKSIKKKSGKYYFCDVMLTAISVSLYNYAVKKSRDLPDVMGVFVPMFPPWYKNYRYGMVENYQVRNIIGMGMVDVSLKAHSCHEKEDLIKRLNFAHENYNNMKNKSLDVMFNRWIGRVLLTLLPTVLSKIFYDCIRPTFILSNIPGCDHLDVFDGCVVKEFITFAPNILTAGVTVLVSTYENKLTLGFTFDKSVVSSVEDGQEICRDVFKTIEKIENLL